MSTVTIPKEITRGEELIVIPRRDYEELLELPKEKKVDRDLERALEDVKKGRVVGPFTNTENLIQSLESE